VPDTTKRRPFLSKTQGRGGFSITELLVSVIVISVGVVGFATAVGLVSTELWYGDRDTNVAMLAADQMERLKSLPYDSLTSGDRTQGSYELEWDVQGADPKKVMLVVGYGTSSFGTRADTLVTFVPR
jgi:Tfp pilus assembly protein PilV